MAETETEEETIVREEKKELGDLIQEIIRGIEDLKQEIKGDTKVKEWLEKKLAELYERQSNISANQQVLLDKMVELEGKPKKPEKT